MQTREKDIRLTRAALLAGGVVYLAWWLVVHIALPGAFNPLGSRLASAASMFIGLALTFASRRILRYADLVYLVCGSIITAHYFYLFDHNAADPGWVVGAYITVLAIATSFVSRRAATGYFTIVSVLGAILTVRHPALAKWVFMPGLLTVSGMSCLAVFWRLRLIEEIERSHGRFESLFHSAPQGAALHDVGIVLDANDALAEILGRARESLVGADLTHFAEGNERERLQEALRPSQSVGEVELRSAKGVPVLVEVRTRDFVERGRRLALSSIVDITERRRVERERVLLDAAKEEVRIRDEFLAVASHELRTPLTPLLIQIESVQKQLDSLSIPHDRSEKLFAQIASAKRQVLRLAALVSVLLDASRIRAGQLTLERSTCDLGEIVRSVVAASEADARAAGCEIRVLESAKVCTEWDRSRVEQVASNLLTNAIRFGRGAPITITIDRTDGHARLTVQDEGIGIPDDFAAHAFDPFERGVSSRNYGGLGLGLFVAKRIVDAHGGTIDVSAGPGRGATFVVTLPIL